MRIAKFPHHKDFATFDYSSAAVRQAQIEPFCSGQFTQDAHNLILVGGTGTGKTHIHCPAGHCAAMHERDHCLGNHIDQSGKEGAFLQRR